VSKINKSYESDIKIFDDYVVKQYKPEYHALNEVFGRCGEQHWYSGLSSDFLLDPIEIHEDYIVLPLVGESIGDAHSINNITFNERDNLKLWLAILDGELVRMGVQHHDINPSNILKDGNAYKLIDLSWMTDIDEDFTGEPYMNISYSRSDSRSIMKMVRELDRMQLKEMSSLDE
jgi:serine/threonine protein kinase